MLFYNWDFSSRWKTLILIYSNFGTVNFFKMSPILKHRDGNVLLNYVILMIDTLTPTQI